MEHNPLPPYRPRHVPDVPEDVDFLMDHLNDPNLDLITAYAARSQLELKQKPSKLLSEIDTESRYESDRYSTSRADSRNSAAIDFEDESPYPEVRAAVSTVDDPLMPANTFRMWFLGIFFVILVAGTNQLFSFRYPSVYISGVVVQLLSLPLGKGLEKLLPTTRFNTFGHIWSFNPGPFSVKEHVCITVMASVVVNGAYATDVVLTQRIFYRQSVTVAYQVLLSLSTQIIGFSLAGLLRQYVVWPASMIWPGALVNCALFNTLHQNFGKSDRGHIPRERFFLIALFCSFVWYWVPGYLFTALSVFNWACWIAPNNVVVNALFGTNNGLGMGIFTFDWSMIAYLDSPLVTPWWSQLNTIVSFVVVFWMIAPIIYFTNTWNSAYFPISSFVSFDNTGSTYNASAIVTADGFFDQAAYQAYSPLFMSSTLAIAYGVGFAALISVVVHTLLWFRRDIGRRFRGTLKDERDVHSRLMLQYHEVPWYWYTLVFGICFIFLMVAISVFPTQAPAWAIIITLLLATILSLPVAMLQAITNQLVPTQIFHEFVAGYILPGRPIANMILKATGHMATTQAVAMAGNFKLGHYMKVPPRLMFVVQLVAATIGCLVVTGVQIWALDNIEDVCTRGQKDGFTCPSSRTFATSSLVWGGIGPKRLFSPGSPYSGVLWFIGIGGLAPVPFYFLARRYPLSFWRYINIPVCFSGLSGMPPATGINFASWAITGFIFNYVIRRFHFRWWMRYNYILSAALDAGVVIALIVLFFTIQYPTDAQITWWGNTVWQNTADANGVSFLTIPTNSIIGPQAWS